MKESFSTKVSRSDIDPKIAGANPLHAKTNINNLLRDSILGKYRAQMLNIEVEYVKSSDLFEITFTTGPTFDYKNERTITSMVKKYLKDPNQ